MFDCHIHTNFSTDSTMKIEEAINISRDLGLGLIITDHMDYKYHQPGWFVFDPDEYFNKYEKYRNDRLLLGVEIGYRDDCIDKITDLNKNYPFDFVIGSIHVVDGEDIYYKDFYEGKSKQEAYGQYLKSILSLVKNHTIFDSLGHMDYISRYSTYEDRALYYRDFADLIDAILKELVHGEKAIEINTRTIDDKITADNFIRILRRFKELGGQYITIGSDAHRPEDIGINFKIAEEITSLCGLKAVYYKGRKIQYL